MQGYTLNYNIGGVSQSVSLGPLQNSYPLSSLTGGNNYTFTIFAFNIYGNGPVSPAVVAWTAQAPDKVAAPTI